MLLMKPWYNAKCCISQEGTIYTASGSADTCPEPWRLAVQLQGGIIPAMEYFRTLRNASSLQSC